MTRALKDDRKPALNGKADSMVVFLHGYGANGTDLIGLAEPLCEHLPGTVFRAPDAPEMCGGNPFGYQWFPIPGMDESTPSQSITSFLQSREDLHAYLDRVIADEGLPAGRVVLFGFSQGTMMALPVAAERKEQLGGVVGFSGRIVGPTQIAEGKSRPPVLLVHGDRDELVPFAALPHAVQVLTAAGFPVQAHVMKGTAHGISQDGLVAALDFLLERLKP